MTDSESKFRVLLVEDHELTRQGLAYGLGKYDQVELVGEAEDGQEAVAFAAEYQPDVILMDIGLPVLNGIEATVKIKADQPNVKVVMLTSHGEQDKVFAAFGAGADGYCMKDIKIDRLAQVIEMVMEGAVWLDPAIAGFVLKAMPAATEAPSSAEGDDADAIAADLTEREREILALMAEGLSNKDIADRLTISLYTVKNHVSNVIQKLAVEDRTQAAVMALKKGLI